jgi:localization factor PodJL
MKPGIPWSVKGIGDDAREAAKQAARRSGMTLGEWLNSVILGQAEGSPAPEQERLAPSPPPPRRQPVQSRDDFSSKLDNIAAQLARLAAREQDTAHFNEPAHEPEADREIINEIIARLDSNERSAAEAFEAIRAHLSSLDEQLAQPAAPAFPEKPEDVPGYQALESALRNIVDHIENSEKKNREALKSVQERMAEVAQKAASAESERILQSAPVIARLEDRLSDVLTRLERTEAATQHAIPSLVELEITKLSERLDAVPDLIAGETGRLDERIETVRHAAEQLAETAQTNALQAAQSELRDIESRIQGALRDTQLAMRSANPAAEIQRLRSDIEGLNQRIDDLKSDAASENDVQSLRAGMEQLSARVAQGPDLRPLAEMDRRLADITRRIEQNQSQTRLEPQIAALERRVYELDQRLAEAMTQRDDTQAAEALERQISAVSDRLGQTEQQIAQLATLDRSISQLFQSLEQSRDAAREIAEDAASRMADRLLKSYPQFAAPAAPEPTVAPSAELVALEQGLEAVRASADSADQRNQETLQAVHDTLEQIVNKIAELESSSLTTPATSAWQDAGGDQTQPEPYEQPQQPAADPFAYVPSPIPEPVVAAAPEQPAFAPPVAEEEPTQSPPAPEPQQGFVGEDFKQDDFIAAARRAAQAAARQPPGPIASSLGFLGRAKAKATKVSKGSSRFSLPFLSQERRNPTPEGEPADTSNAGKRKRLILAGLILLAAVSAYAFNTIGTKPKGSPVAQETTAPAIEDKSDAAAKAEPVAAAKAEPISAAQTTSSKSDSLAKDEILTASWSAAPPLPEKDAAAAPVRETLPDIVGPEGLRNAALNGDPQAQFIVAGRYLDGKSVEQDYAAAARWYQKAAAKGLAPAQYRIGTLFERGKGVPQDMALARVWYERAAGRGNVKAMHNVGVIYAGDQAGNPDYAKAARWFTEAGEHGLKDSQYNLAVLYERGLGVKQDAGQALYWYSLAAKQGDGDGAMKAGTLERMLAPSTVASVKERVAAFSAKEDSAEANVVAVGDPTWQNGAPQPAMAEALRYDMPVLGAAVDMSSASAPLDPISETQTLLNGLGYDIGSPDGKMNTRTANAIRLFQLQSGMKVTGEVSDELITKLKAKKG